MGEYYEMDPRESRPDIEMSPRDPVGEGEDMSVRCSCCENSIDSGGGLCAECTKEVKLSVEAAESVIDGVETEIFELSQKLSAALSYLREAKFYL